jgi:NSS family neurotransmitter:Na+ symporter
MLAYGSYVAKGTSLVRSAIIISGSILLVSLLATLMIFPLVFRYGMNPAQGPELVFGVLATVFAEMPGGRLVGTLFFLLLVLAALTPSIAAFEPLVAWLQQRWGFSRAAAVGAAISAVWMVGIGSVVSFSRDKAFFNGLDFVSSNILLPAGAFATSILVGWRLNRTILDDELSETTPFARRWCVWALRYACPIAIAAVFIAALQSAGL